MNSIETLVYSNKWSIRILRHALFWTIDCVSVLVVISAEYEINNNTILSRFLVIPLTASITYFIIYYLIPSYAKDFNLLKLSIGIIFSLVFVAYGIRYYRLCIVYPIIDPDFNVNANIWNIGKVITDAFRWIPGVCLAIVIKVMKNRTELLHTTKLLLEEKKLTELAFLKAQMHPHFLFNTLNTLYSYSINNIDPKSEQIILHLSDLMRFILEECDKKLILVEQEIKVIRDYLELEKLRHGERLQIDFKPEFKDREYISPLLLLPIIENCCKHTVSSNRGKIQIVITIKSENNFIWLYTENDLIQNAKEEQTHGRGLDSVAKQLSLLYGTNHIFETKISNGKFIVNLSMPVMKHYE